MTTLNFLESNERRAFDAIPSFTARDRQLYFSLDTPTRRRVGPLKTPANKIGYVLQLGYFRAKGKFFQTSDFKKKDIKFVKRMLGYAESTTFGTRSYPKSTSHDHQEKILHQEGWKECDKSQKALLIEHAQAYAEIQRKPRQMFKSLLDDCWRSRFLIPTYSELADIITNAHNQFEARLLTKAEEILTDDDCKNLDLLLDYRGKDKHPITQLKTIEQSLKPGKIAQSLKVYHSVSTYFLSFEDAIEELELSDAATHYFGIWVTKARASQLRDLSNRYKSYFHLMAYFKHQMYLRQDALVKLFL